MQSLASLHHLSDWALLVLRLGLGTVFLVHGIQKRAMWKMQPSAQMPAGLLSIIKVLSIAEPLSGLAMIGGLLAAASGVMLGIYYIQIQFNNGFLLGLRAFTAAVLGGIGNIPGAMAGGMIIGLLESYTAGYISSKWQDVVVFGVLILVLVIRPMGLFGERVAERM